MESKFSWFGIDFGTTNSAAFSLTGMSRSSVMPISYGDDEGRPFPSVVAINKKTGEVLVGRDAKERRNSLRETHYYFPSIKMILDSDERWDIAGQVWSPEDITAQILAALKKKVEKNNENKLIEAVLAVPVGYSAQKKTHLRNAAKKAGIEVKMFVSEPTAAFCSNYYELRSCKNVAVFDWGGGTLDVAILSINDGSVKELATGGMSFAGDMIDEKFAEKMHSKFMRKNNGKITFSELDSITKDSLIVKCEEAKCQFEDEDVVLITLNRYDTFGAVRESMEYEEFAELIEPDIDRAIGCLKNTITKAGLNKANIDRILCVGGSSRLRPLQEKLAGIYGSEMILNPEKVMWDIANGAAIISTKEGRYKLGKSIGLELSDGTYFELIKEDQQLPTEEFQITLSIVDQDTEGPKEGRFIFTDTDNEKERELYSPVVIPLRGFEDEVLKLKCYIDQDNIFKAKIGSTRTHDSCSKVWCYENLKISFSLED